MNFVLVVTCRNDAFDQVMLSDGDLSSLENMKVNLGLNQLSTRVDTSERSDDPNVVCSLY